MQDEFKKLNELVSMILDCTQQMLNSQQEEEPKLVKWLDKYEVKAYLRISSTTYYEWRNRGILVPSSTLGGDRYLVKDILKLVAQRHYRKRFNLDPKEKNK